MSVGGIADKRVFSPNHMFAAMVGMPSDSDTVCLHAYAAVSLPIGWCAKVSRSGSAQCREKLSVIPVHCRWVEHLKGDRQLEMQISSLLARDTLSYIVSEIADILVEHDNDCVVSTVPRR